MNEPVVESLNYILKTSDEMSFDNPPILEVDLPSFKITLENGNLNVKMKDYYSTEKQARTIVEPFLKVWELDNFLTYGRKELWFEFIDSKIVDKNPISLDGSCKVIVKSMNLNCTLNPVKVHVTRNIYPFPPKDICYSPDVKSLNKRFEGFLNGKEPLLSMAYFCLTIIESIAKHRALAGKTYSIQKEVLDILGKLTSERGDKSEARKVKGRLSFEPLTESEKKWIIETIKLLIRRKAEYDFNPNTKFTEITMDLLPEI